MRTGPFSQTTVIERLNAHFVPVYVVNEDYAEDGPAPTAEKAERNRIYRESLAAGMSTGTVHVYILDPGGKPLGTLHVAQAAKTPKLLELLDRVIADLKVAAGKPLIPPKPQSKPPRHEPGSLVLHLAARGLGGGGSWDGTAENWIVYTPAEVERLLPAEQPQPGATWQPDPALIERLYRYIYPVTENNDPAKNEIQFQQLSARVLSVEDGTVRVRLDGRLRMRHDFYHKPDGKVVDARLIGYLDYDPARRRIMNLRLVTDDATYGGGTFGAAVRSEQLAAPISTAASRAAAGWRGIPPAGALTQRRRVGMLLYVGSNVHPSALLRAPISRPRQRSVPHVRFAGKRVASPWRNTATQWCGPVATS